jgi:hypothetical protein
MLQNPNSPVSVIFASDHRRGQNRPFYLFWNSQKYPITKLAFHHTFSRGRTLFHIYSVLSNKLYFRLSLNTQTLSWSLEEVSDGLPD